MLYELILGASVIIYLFWRYFISSNQEQITNEDHHIVEDTSTGCNSQICREVPVEYVNILNHNTAELTKLVTETSDVQKTFQYLDSKACESIREAETADLKQKLSAIAKTKETHFTPSAILKKREDKSKDPSLLKRESPPKEKFNEFLEKTVLNDDKINSIIHNLSLDNNTRIKPPKIDEPLLDLTITPIVKNNSYANAQTGNNLNIRHELINILKPYEQSVDHKSIKEPSKTKSETCNKWNDIFKPKEDKTISYRHTIAIPDDTSEQFENILKYNESLPVLPNDCKDITFDDIVGSIPDSVEPTLIVKRIQKNPGFPPGLNFGSVIGELKNKTKNGGLKPVFKKFEADSVDNAVQVLCISKFNCSWNFFLSFRYRLCSSDS